jgi:hypothetical protein
VWNVVSNAIGGSEIEGVLEQGAEENIYTDEEYQETGEKCIKRSFIICTPRQILLRLKIRWERRVTRMGEKFESVF